MFNAPRKHEVPTADISKVLLMSLTFPIGLLGGTQIEISLTKKINLAFPTSFLRFLDNLEIIVHFSDTFDFSENAKKGDNEQMIQVEKHVKYFEIL